AHERCGGFVHDRDEPRPEHFQRNGIEAVASRHDRSFLRFCCVLTLPIMPCLHRADSIAASRAHGCVRRCQVRGRTRTLSCSRAREAFMAEAPALTYVATPTAALYAQPEGRRRRIELLWGDRVQVLDATGARWRVRARGVTGFVAPTVLGDTSLLEVYFIDV